MKYNLTREQQKELKEIGELYQKTIYDSSLETLPDMVKAFANGLQDINGDISSSITSEVSRFHKLISSNYTAQMRKRIDGLYTVLSQQLPKNVLFTITCRQKAWQSALRKILKYYFEGESIMLLDIVALRINIDSSLSEEEQKKICHTISDICITYLRKSCSIVPPTKRVAGNTLLKDYIDHPKPNKYQSIHLAFIDDHNNIFEVQIRTQEMDINAEYGPEEDVENITDNNLDHLTYKQDEYKELIEYISFDPEKVNKPFFRVYRRINPESQKNEFKELMVIITDKIGLKHAKPVEERARTF